MRRLTDEEIVKLWRACEARTDAMARQFDITGATMSGLAFRGATEEENEEDGPVSFVFETWLHIPDVGFMSSTAAMGESATVESVVAKLIGSA